MQFINLEVVVAVLLFVGMIAFIALIYTSMRALIVRPRTQSRLSLGTLQTSFTALAHRFRIPTGHHLAFRAKSQTPEITPKILEGRSSGAGY